MRNIVYPAVLATSWDEYRYKIETAATFAEGVQIDVMDGRFVPATTFYNKEKIVIYYIESLLKI
jgi:pentose-5-phosphate-3-epimerase